MKQEQESKKWTEFQNQIIDFSKFLLIPKDIIKRSLKVKLNSGNIHFEDVQKS
jgi:hypothetical protein